MASTRATIHADIHRRLAIPEMPEWIANAVGVAVSTVYRHRSGACKCGNSGAARKDDGLESFRDIDFDAELKAMGFPTLEQQLEKLEEIARALGFPTLEEQLEQLARALGLPSYEEQMEMLNQHLKASSTD